MIYRIDPTTNPPTQTWYSYLTTPDFTESFHKLVVGTYNGVTSVYGWGYLYSATFTPCSTCPAIMRVDAQNGTLYDLKYYQAAYNMWGLKHGKLIWYKMPVAIFMWYITSQIVVEITFMYYKLDPTLTPTWQSSYIWLIYCCNLLDVSSSNWYQLETPICCSCWCWL